MDTKEKARGHGKNRQSVTGAAARTPSPASPRTVAPGRVDAVGRSLEAQLRKQALQVIAQTPEMRADRVAALKAAVLQGAYQVDAARAANSLIAHLLLEGKK